MIPPVARFEAGQLIAFVRRLAEASNMPADDAAWLAEALVETELWGVPTHGLVQLPGYLSAMAAGDINVRPQISLLHQMPAAEVHDGDGGSGFVVARAAMTRAVEIAATHGIGMVTTRNSTHFGAAGLYSALAARSGMVGIALTSAVPTMAAGGSLRPVVGNNPLSVAAPRGADFPFMLDMAMSVASFHRVKQAAAAGETVPAGWGTDENGEPTTDPSRVEALSPVGGHKGVGLALAAEVLTSVLAGGATLSEITASGATGHGSTHTMIAISTAQVVDGAGFSARMNHVAEQVGTMRTLEGTVSRLPGERRGCSRAQRLIEGVPLPNAVVADLRLWAETLGEDLDLRPVS